MTRKYFQNCRTAEELKKTYKELVFKLHPDNNPDHDTTRDFQDMQSEFREVFEGLKNIHVNASGERYTKETTETASEYMDIIDRLINIPGIVVEVCGSWLWISGNTKPVKEELKQMKFKFSGKKQAWYYHRDPYRKMHKGTMTMDQIRGYYGSTRYTPDPEDGQKVIA